MAKKKSIRSYNDEERKEMVRKVLDREMSQAEITRVYDIDKGYLSRLVAREREREEG